MQVASDDSGDTDDSEDELGNDVLSSKMNKKGIINIDMKLIGKWSASLNVSIWKKVILSRNL